MTYVVLLLALTWALILGGVIMRRAYETSRDRLTRLHSVWIDKDGVLWIKERRFARPKTFVVWENTRRFYGSE